MSNKIPGGLGSVKFGRVSSTLNVPLYGDLKINNGVIVSGRPEQRMYALATGAASIDAVSEMEKALDIIEETISGSIKRLQSNVGKAISDVRDTGSQIQNDVRKRVGKSPQSPAELSQDKTAKYNETVIADADLADSVKWKNGLAVINNVELQTSAKDGTKASPVPDNSETNLTKGIQIIIDAELDNFNYQVKQLLDELEETVSTSQQTMQEKRDQYFSDFSTEANIQRFKTELRSSNIDGAGSDVGFDMSNLKDECKTLSDKPLKITEDGIIVAGSKNERKQALLDGRGLFDLVSALDNKGAEAALPYVEIAVNSQIDGIVEYSNEIIEKIHELSRETIHRVKKKILEMDDFREGQLNTNNPSSVGVTSLDEYMKEVGLNNPADDFVNNVEETEWDECFGGFRPDMPNGSATGYMCMELGSKAEAVLDRFQTTLSGFDSKETIFGEMETIANDWITNGNDAISSVSDLNNHTHAINNVGDYFTGGDFGLSSNNTYGGTGMAQAWQCLGLTGSVPGFNLGWDLNGVVGTVASVGQIPFWLGGQVTKSIECLLGTLPEYNLLNMMNLFPTNWLDSLLGLLQCLDYNCNSSNTSNLSYLPTPVELETELDKYGVGLDGTTNLRSIAQEGGGNVAKVFTPTYAGSLQALKGSSSNVKGIITDKIGLGWDAGALAKPNRSIF